MYNVYSEVQVVSLLSATGALSKSGWPMEFEL